MTKKYYWAIAVAAAFVAGTMTTGGVVYASFDQCNNNPPQGISGGKPFLEIWQAICDLETQVGDINVDDADALPKSTYRVIGSDQGSNQTIEAEASCDEGDVLLSCGFFSVPSVTIHGSVPFPETQRCIAFALVSGDSVESVTAFALCADIDPPHVEDP